MLLGTQQKQERENRRILVNYAPWLGSVDRLLETTIPAVVQRIDGLPLDPVWAPTMDGPYVMNQRTALALYVAGGADGVDYKITIWAETTEGRLREDEVYLQVREI